MSDDLLKLVNQDKLLRWMDSQQFESGPIENAQLLSAGTQNILLAFTRGEQKFILRRPPPHLRKNSNETIRREARMLAAITDSDSN